MCSPSWTPLPHLFLVSSFRSIPFLCFIEPIFSWNVPLVSSFLDEISSLSRSIVFLYFFALITEEGFLISPCYSLELYIHMGIAICKASSDSHFAFLHFFFLGMVSITASCTMSRTSIHSSSGTLSDLIPWIYLSLPLYNHKGFDLSHTCMV